MVLLGGVLGRSTGIAVNRMDPSHLGSGGLEDGRKCGRTAASGHGCELQMPSPRQAAGRRSRLAVRYTGNATVTGRSLRTRLPAVRADLPIPAQAGAAWDSRCRTCACRCPATRPTSDVQCTRPTWIPRPENVSPLSHDASSFRPSAHARARFMSGESVPGGVAQPASMTAL